MPRKASRNDFVGQENLGRERNVRKMAVRWIETRRRLSSENSSTFDSSKPAEDAMRAREVPAPDKDVINWIYAGLNVLDAKANGLLRINALFITVLIAMLGLRKSDGHGLIVLQNSYVTLAQIDVAIFVISSFFCLMIVRIKWKFLAKVRKTTDGYTFADEITVLANILDDRTHLYFLAWYGTVSGILLSVIWSLVLTFGEWVCSFF